MINKSQVSIDVCFHTKWKCNGIKNCNNNEDELNCPATTVLTTTEQPSIKLNNLSNIIINLGQNIQIINPNVTIIKQYQQKLKNQCTKGRICQMTIKTIRLLTNRKLYAAKENQTIETCYGYKYICNKEKQCIDKTDEPIRCGPQGPENWYKELYTNNKTDNLWIIERDNVPPDQTYQARKWLSEWWVLKVRKGQYCTMKVETIRTITKDYVSGRSSAIRVITYGWKYQCDGIKQCINGMDERGYCPKTTIQLTTLTKPTYWKQGINTHKCHKQNNYIWVTLKYQLTKYTKNQWNKEITATRKHNGKSDEYKFTKECNTTEYERINEKWLTCKTIKENDQGTYLWHITDKKQNKTQSVYLTNPTCKRNEWKPHIVNAYKTSMNLWKKEQCPGLTTDICENARKKGLCEEIPTFTYIGKLIDKEIIKTICPTTCNKCKFPTFHQLTQDKAECKQLGNQTENCYTATKISICKELINCTKANQRCKVTKGTCEQKTLLGTILDCNTKANLKLMDVKTTTLYQK